MEFKDLNLTQLDKNLTEPERDEWQAIYASYRGRSLISGSVVGVDLHEFKVVPEGETEPVRKTVRCLIVIKYRVKIIIPETEVFIDELDTGYHVLHSMCGASVDYVITHIDREEGFAFASRKLALEQIRRANVRRRYKEGQIVDVGVISVGRGVCTVTFNGYDVMLPQREISYSAVPDLREVLHPGDVRKAVVKEFSRADDVLKLSIKETMPHPFDGIETRHPLGCTRISTIVGKYGGGVFCRLYDGVTDVLLDETLVMLTLAGDTDAYNQLITRHHHAVFVSAVRITGSNAMAEDAVQDAFVLAWMKLNTLRQPEKFGAWVCRISRNCALNILAKDSRLVALDQAQIPEPADSADMNPAFISVMSEEKAEIQTCLEQSRRLLEFLF